MNVPALSEEQLSQSWEGENIARAIISCPGKLSKQQISWQ